MAEVMIESNKAVSESDPLSLHLNQTAPQTVIGGSPIFNLGITTTVINVPAASDLTFGIPAGYFGKISSHLRPDTDNAYDLGYDDGLGFEYYFRNLRITGDVSTLAKPAGTGYFTGLSISNSILFTEISTPATPPEDPAPPLLIVISLSSTSRLVTF